MFYTESEYSEHNQKTGLSRAAEGVYHVLMVIGAFIIGLSLGISSQNVFHYLSSFWYICGIGLVVYLVLRYAVKTKDQNVYTVMSPGEWLGKTSLPVKFWMKNTQVITFDTHTAHLQSEIADVGETVFFSVLLSLTLVEIPYFVLSSAFYLLQNYNVSIILLLTEITVTMLFILWFGYSILLPLYIIFIVRSSTKWTITKHNISEVQLSIRGSESKPFHGILPLTCITTSSVQEYQVKDIIKNSGIGRLFIKRLDKTLFNSSLYALVIAVSLPPSITGSTVEYTSKHPVPTSTIILLKNKNKELVQDFQKVLALWIQA